MMEIRYPTDASQRLQLIMNRLNTHDIEYSAAADATQHASAPPGQEKKLILGSGFAVPGPYDVICARGKVAWNHTGNKFFRKLVDQGSRAYGAANTKLERSLVVSDIVDKVRSRGNGFIKLDKEGTGTGQQWVEIGDYLAREKVGQMLRNSCSSKYKSSSKAKKSRRQETNGQRIEECQQILESNRHVRQTMEEVNQKANPQLGGGITDGEAMMLFNQANAHMLSLFKNDPNLTMRFHDACYIRTVGGGGNSTASISHSSSTGQSPPLSSAVWTTTTASSWPAMTMSSTAVPTTPADGITSDDDDDDEDDVDIIDDTSSIQTIENMTMMIE